MSGYPQDGAWFPFWAHMTCSWVISSNTIILFGCSVVLNTLRVLGFWFFEVFFFLVFLGGGLRNYQGTRVRIAFPASWNFLTLEYNMHTEKCLIINEFSPKEHGTHIKEPNMTCTPPPASFQSLPAPEGTPFSDF